jgi:hypothetical protein
MRDSCLSGNNVDALCDIFQHRLAQPVYADWRLTFVNNGNGFWWHNACWHSNAIGTMAPWHNQRLAVLTLVLSLSLSLTGAILSSCAVAHTGNSSFVNFILLAQ